MTLDEGRIIGTKPELEQGRIDCAMMLTAFAAPLRSA